MKEETKEKINVLIGKINGEIPLDGPFDYPGTELLSIVLFGDDPLETWSKLYNDDLGEG